MFFFYSRGGDGILEPNSLDLPNIHKLQPMALRRSHESVFARFALSVLDDDTKRLISGVLDNEKHMLNGMFTRIMIAIAGHYVVLFSRWHITPTKVNGDKALFIDDALFMRSALHVHKLITMLVTLVSPDKPGLLSVPDLDSDEVAVLLIPSSCFNRQTKNNEDGVKQSTAVTFLGDALRTHKRREVGRKKGAGGLWDYTLGMMYDSVAEAVTVYREVPLTYPESFYNSWVEHIEPSYEPDYQKTSTMWGCVLAVGLTMGVTIVTKKFMACMCSRGDPSYEQNQFYAARVRRLEEELAQERTRPMSAQNMLSSPPGDPVTNTKRITTRDQPRVAHTRGHAQPATIAYRRSPNSTRNRRPHAQRHRLAYGESPSGTTSRRARARPTQHAYKVDSLLDLKRSPSSSPASQTRIHDTQEGHSDDSDDSDDSDEHWVIQELKKLGVFDLLHKVDVDQDGFIAAVIQSVQNTTF